MYKRKRYVFCSAACHAKFKRSPDGFVH
ncbi:MAG: hypothetical protein M1357_02675 [Candidatus Marsarchaeota archaeon]|nr:hypothetical protein [Candidatus Marsarchaeota archaeon]